MQRLDEGARSFEPEEQGEQTQDLRACGSAFPLLLTVPSPSKRGVRYTSSP